MSIDYALAKRLCTKHRAALTRARKVGPEQVVVAVDAFYADFDFCELPLPDDWRLWGNARDDAKRAIARKAAETSA